MKLKNLKITVLLLFCTLCGFSEPQECAILNRVVVTGASVTSGYGLKTPPIPGDLGGYPMTLQHIMEGLIIAPHEDVKIVSEMMFFRNPKEHGDAFIKQIKTHDPTLVVGIDFLFWFAYGGTGFEEPAQHRKEKFEHGLTLLSQISVPLVIGDLPDMRRAVGKMLSAHQVPSTETIKILNERLRAWALEHPNVIVLPAHDLIQSILNDEEVTVLNSTWAEGSKAQLVQPDMLHLTLEGAVVSTLMVIEALGTDCVETDPKVIMKNAAAIARLHNQ